MKIVTVVGARPQFVKAATISREIAGRTGIREVIVHTGQHHDANMSDVFFEEMRIPRPDYQLEIHGGTHGAMTGRMLETVERVLIDEKPDVVLVYGDTNSTLAGALAAAKLHIPVAHVEAGLRSFNRQMPEEVNRVLTDHLARWLFCPSDQAVENLRAEGIQGASVVRTGDVMLDAAMFYGKLARDSSAIIARVGGPGFVLATIHRAENTDDPARLGAIIAALSEVARSTRVVIPLHPRTRKKLAEFAIADDGLTIIDPVGYFDMLALIDSASAVMTDSGGLQKEAYMFGKPCITLRNETEWVELVNAGVNRLAGSSRDAILAAWAAMRDVRISAPGSLYGDGHAARAVIDTLAGAFAGQQAS